MYKNKQDKRNKEKEWYYRKRKDPDFLLRSQQRSIEWNTKNPKKKMLNAARRTAKVKGLEFNITEDDLVIPENCPYFGYKLTNIQGQGRIKTNMSIDRIDSTKGYIKGNIQIISHLANVMKQDCSQDELIAFAKGVLSLIQSVLDTKI